jgi:hypothetical protein
MIELKCRNWLNSTSGRVVIEFARVGDLSHPASRQVGVRDPARRDSVMADTCGICPWTALGATECFTRAGFEVTLEMKFLGARLRWAARAER